MMAAPSEKKDPGGVDVMPAPDGGHLNGKAPTGSVNAPRVETPTAQPVLNRTATVAAIGVLVVYIAALWLCFEHRADASWDRIVYLLSGFEAIVFVAVGAIFGTTVQRTNVATAQANAQQARADARDERDRADHAVGQGASGRALAAGIRSYAASRLNNPAQPATAAEPRHGASAVRGTTADQAGSDLSFLVQLADDLFPRDG
jgi:hypothetical protein